MIVMKFGGSSLADAACFEQVAGLVNRALSQGPLVVLSAVGETTNRLEEAARRAETGGLPEALRQLEGILALHRHIAAELRREDSRRDGGEPVGAGGIGEALESAAAEIEVLLKGVAHLRELTPRTLDVILSFGERLSTRLFAFYTGAEWVDARRFMRTDGRFGRAQPDRQALGRLAREHLEPRLGPGAAVVTQGFVGATEDGQTTTLGRGGSDYSASLLGVALEASEVQIWTDVEGVFTCDPRMVPDATPLPFLTFAEASELAAFGARVLHPATLQPAVEAGVPLTVRHTHKPEGSFTTVSAGRLRTRRQWALAGRGPVTVLTVTSAGMLQQPGFLARLFEVFGRHEVSVDLVATAEVSVSLTVEEDAPVAALVEEISTFGRVEVTRGRALVAVVGQDLKRISGLGARIFGALTAINVEMISMGASDINLSLIVRQEQMVETLQRLHGALTREEPRVARQPEVPRAMLAGSDP